MTPTSTPISVVVVSDSFLLGEGLVSMLSEVSDVSIAGRAGDHYHLLSLVDEVRPDVLLYGIRTSVVTTMATITVARNLRLEYPDMGFVVIADRANGFATELLRGGASRVAYLLDQHLPGIEAVVASLRSVRVGESVLDPAIVESLISGKGGRAIDQLTPREHAVLEQMAFGLTNAAIADALSVSIKTIEKGVTAIFLKLGPFDPKLVDRRVSCCLEYFRAQANPFQREDLVTAPLGVDEVTTSPRSRPSPTGTVA